MWPATIIHSTPVHAAATAAAAANTHHYNGPRGTAGWPTPYPLASVSSRSRFLQRTSTASHIRPDCLVTTQHNGHRRHRPTSKAYINRRHNRVVCMSNGASEDSNKLPANTDLQNPLHQPVPLVWHTQAPCRFNYFRELLFSCTIKAFAVLTTGLSFGLRLASDFARFCISLMSAAHHLMLWTLTQRDTFVYFTVIFDAFVWDMIIAFQKNARIVSILSVIYGTIWMAT